MQKFGLLRIHRWAGIAALAFWIAQALSGALIVFHWEVDDYLLDGQHVPFTATSMETNLQRIAPQGSDRSISSMWTSAGTADRFDLFVSTPEESLEIRVDGAGNILRTSGEDDQFTNGVWLEKIVSFHHDFLLGDTGSLIAGISGILLVSNIIMGLWLTLRNGGRLKSLLVPLRTGAPLVRFYSWHRAIGLWLAAPAILSISAGVLLVFIDTAEEVVAPPPRTLPALETTTPITTGFAAAVETAMGRFPDASLTSVSFPDQDDKSYTIRLLQPGENRRAYGTTTVVVSAVDGSIRGAFDALAANPRRGFIDGLFPFHTGELGGLFGRILIMTIGIWLMTVSILGFLLWRKRRHSPRGK